MAVFNGELFVREAIESVLQQSFTDFELIILDDCSTDNSISIINSINDERIKLIQNSGNRGISFCRNRLLEKSAGVFISFMDADDIIHPEKFKKQLTFLKNNPDYGLVGSSVYLINEEGKVIRKLKLGANAGKIPAMMLFRNYFVNSAVMFRREKLPDMPFDPDLEFGEDYMLWWKILQNTKGINLPLFLCSYRIHPQSLTQLMAGRKSDFDKKVYTLIFKDIGINLSEDEAEVHSFLANGENITSISQMKSILSWFARISSCSRNSNLKAVNSVLRERWMKVCYQARRNPFYLIWGLSNYLLKFRLFFLNK